MRVQLENKFVKFFGIFFSHVFKKKKNQPIYPYHSHVTTAASMIALHRDGIQKSPIKCVPY